ncbi:MAG: hypothetical protein ACLRPV_17955 [Lacrimispora saccharolytica]
MTVLDLVFRQGKTSNIHLNARKMLANRTDFGFGDDFQFISCNSADETAAMVRQLYQEEAARNGLDHVQILTPYG